MLNIRWTINSTHHPHSISKKPATTYSNRAASRDLRVRPIPPIINIIIITVPNTTSITTVLPTASRRPHPRIVTTTAATPRVPSSIGYSRIYPASAITPCISSMFLTTNTMTMISTMIIRSTTLITEVIRCRSH